MLHGIRLVGGNGWMHARSHRTRSRDTNCFLKGYVVPSHNGYERGHMMLSLRYRVRNAVCMESHSAQHDGEGHETYEFTYQGSDGRQKATFEQAFKNNVSSKQSLHGSEKAPWELSYQMSEKNLAWNDELKSRLLARVAAEELGIDELELTERLERLQTLLPDLAGKLAVMKPSIVTQLLRDIDVIPARIIALKETFPNANASRLSVREPALVLGFVDNEHLQNIAHQLRELFPSLDVDRLVEENPSMLDIEELRHAMAEAERIMPNLDIEKAMGSDPQIILSFQRGSQLIPYDPPVPDIEDQDEYSAYYQ